MALVAALGSFVSESRFHHHRCWQHLDELVFSYLTTHELVVKHFYVFLFQIMLIALIRIKIESFRLLE